MSGSVEDRLQRSALRSQALAMLSAGQPQRAVAAALGLPPGSIARWAAVEAKQSPSKRSTRPPSEARTEALAEQTRAGAVIAAWSRIEREEAEIVGQLAANAKLIVGKIEERVRLGREVTAGAKGGEQDVSLRDLVGALEYTVKNWNLLRGGPTQRTEAKAEVTGRDGNFDDPEYRDLIRRLYHIRTRGGAEPIRR